MHAPPSDRSYDILGFGEASIDEVWRLPEGFALGHKAQVTEQHRLGGGQIATALVAASRLGGRAGFLGPIGDDALGIELTAGLRADGVAIIAGAIVAGLPSRNALILVEANGERSVLERAPSPTPTAVPKAALKRTRALHLDGTRIDAALVLAQEARALGVWVSLDLDTASPAALPLVASSDIVVLGRGVASALTGQSEVATALATLSGIAPAGALVVETRGADGALALIEGDVVGVPAFPTAVVDSTACGDTFRGALLVAMLSGMPIRAALRFASGAASLKCRAIGRLGCPTRAELDAFLLANV